MYKNENNLFNECLNPQRLDEGITDRIKARTQSAISKVKNTGKLVGNTVKQASQNVTGNVDGAKDTQQSIDNVVNDTSTSAVSKLDDILNKRLTKNIVDTLKDASILNKDKGIDDVLKRISNDTKVSDKVSLWLKNNLVNLTSSLIDDANGISTPQPIPQQQPNSQPFQHKQSNNRKVSNQKVTNGSLEGTQSDRVLSPRS